MYNQSPHHNQRIPELRCDVFSDVTILPQIYVGIVDEGPFALFACGAFCDENILSQVHGLPGLGRVNAQLPYIKAQQIIDKEVIYAGEFLGYWGQWGHFLLETLQRLWYTKHKNLPIAWVLHEKENCDYMSFFTAKHKEVFHSLGIDNEHILITEPTQFKKVHFPEPGLSISGYAQPEQINFLGYYEGQVRKGKYVYLSRSRYEHCSNEKQLEDILKNYGWEIIFPEDLAVSEQLEVLTSAEVCMMISGSAQHTLLLTKNSKTRFIVIPRMHTAIYNTIAHFKSDNYFLLELEKKISNPGTPDNRKNFTLDLTELQKIIEKTHNFTVNLFEFSHVLRTPDKMSEDNMQIPASYYAKDCSVPEVEKNFYKAIFFHRAKKYTEAYEILMELYDKKLLKLFMYDYFFNIIENYDSIHGTKTQLDFDRQQFSFERAKKILMSNPEDSNNYIILAKHFYKRKSFDAAIKVLHNALKKFPKWGLAYATIAQIYLTQEENNLAMSYAQKAFHVDPSNAETKKLLAYCMHLLRNPS